MDKRCFVLRGTAPGMAEKVRWGRKGRERGRRWRRRMEGGRNILVENLRNVRGIEGVEKVE